MLRLQYFIVVVLSLAAVSIARPLTSQAAAFDPSCKCDTKTTWNDVVFVVDISNTSNEAELKARFASLTNILSTNFNVQPVGYNGSNYFLQAGVIFYNSEVTVAANLGSSMNTLNNLNTDHFYDQNDSQSNLGTAIYTATNMFDYRHHRSHSQKVIVVIASKYNPGDATDSPQEAARHFERNEGGIIITYNVASSNGQLEPVLQQIASTNYNFDSISSNLTVAMNAQCDANCFCPYSATTFQLSPRLTPVGGCYDRLSQPYNYPLAQRKCVEYFNTNSIIVKIENSAQNNFTAAVQSLGFGTQAGWIGLTWDVGISQWIWSDGTPLGSYNNFVPGTSHTTGNDCVTLQTFTTLWKPAPCTAGYWFVCEFEPCDSTNFCGNDF